MSEALQAASSYHHGDLRQAMLDRAAVVIQSKGIEALSLRGLARDLGVSHAAPNRHFKNKTHLLTAMATDGYTRLKEATLTAAGTVTDDSWVRLNAMGQGYLHWALDNPASFNAIMHPDLGFYDNPELDHALQDFRKSIYDAVATSRTAGRHENVPLDILNIFTISVPMGAAKMLAQTNNPAELQKNKGLIADLIELVVPILDRTHSK